MEIEKPPEKRNIGAIFVNKASKIKMYTVFCADMPNSRNFVNNLFQKDKDFANFLTVIFFFLFFR